MKILVKTEKHVRTLKVNIVRLLLNLTITLTCVLFTLKYFEVFEAEKSLVSLLYSSIALLALFEIWGKKTFKTKKVLREDPIDTRSTIEN